MKKIEGFEEGIVGLLVAILLMFMVIAGITALTARPAHALTITSNGAVYRNQSFTGNCEIKADNVTVDNCRFTGSLSIQSGSDNFAVTRSTFDGPFLNLAKWTLSSLKSGRIEDCAFRKLGQGVTSGEHIVIFWDVDGLEWHRNQLDITIEAGLPTSAGGWWLFDVRNVSSSDNRVVINCKRDSYAAWRLRADVSRQIGCFNVNMLRDTVIVRGANGRMLLSSSGMCDGSQAGCWGAWGVTATDCLFETPGDIYFQGGMHDWHFKHSTLRAANVTAFDIHQSSIQNSAIDGNLRWTDEYSRPLWGPGDMIFACSNVTGSTSTAPKLAAVSGAVLSSPCLETPAPEPPPTIPPAPCDTVRVPAPKDTVRITVDAAGAPVKVTVK